MNRVKSTASVAFAQRDIAPVSGTAQYFTVGNPQTSTPATVLPGYWLNMQMDELMSILAAAGLTADDTNWSQVWQGILRCGTFADAGGVNVLSVNLPSGTVFPSSALGFGTTVTIQAAVTNTSATPTINLFGSGAKTIVHGDSSALIPGDIQAGQFYQLLYDGTNFRMLARNPTFGRLRLTSNLTIFVATTGNDSNNGLTSGTAFATLNKAWQYIQTSLDLNGFTVTVSVANGAYAPLSATGALVGATLGVGSVIFVGNVGAPGSVTISATNANAIFAGIGVSFTVRGFQVSATGASPFGCGISVTNGAFIAFSSITFAACQSAHISAGGTGQIQSETGAAYSISGNAAIHWNCDDAAMTFNGATVTLTGTPAFSSQFAFCNDNGMIFAPSVTFLGSATGPRYSAINKGGINTGGGGATYLPGNSAGSATAPGFYA
jgi:hypothetical protein